MQLNSFHNIIMLMKYSATRNDYIQHREYDVSKPIGSEIGYGISTSVFVLIYTNRAIHIDTQHINLRLTNISI